MGDYTLKRLMLSNIGGNLENLVKDNFQILQENPHLRLKIITNIAKGLAFQGNQKKV